MPNQERSGASRLSRRQALGFVATATSGILVASNMDAAVAYGAKPEAAVQAVAAQSGDLKLTVMGATWKEPKGGSAAVKEAVAAITNVRQEWPETANDAREILAVDERAKSLRWKEVNDYAEYGVKAWATVDPVEGDTPAIFNTTGLGMTGTWYVLPSGETYRRFVARDLALSRGVTIRPIIDCDHIPFKRDEFAASLPGNIDPKTIEIVGNYQTLTGRK